MTYLSCFSGIEAASCAWHPLGMEPVAFAEIEPFPSAVLAHRFPSVPNLGDITKFQEWTLGKSVDILVGGSPCQSFSVAGLRKGLADPRGNLALVYLGIADKFRPRWIVWENVPGVLSSNKGRDFGAFLGALGELGYGWSYRVLDAQYFGVAQRRRRVFVVGYLGDWRPAAAVLFESQSLRGYPAPRRKEGKGASGGVEIGPYGGRFTEISATLNTKSQNGPIQNQSSTAVLCFEPRSPDGHARVVEGGIAPTLNRMGGGQREPCVATYDMKQHHNPQTSDTVQLTTKNAAQIRGDSPLIATYPISSMAAMSRHGDDRIGIGIGEDCDPAPTLSKAHHHAVGTATTVRRLTPRECERLQGFPDDWTLIPWRGKPAEDCPDGPRYKAIGNSMAVPVMRWIGKRIKEVNK